MLKKILVLVLVCAAGPNAFSMGKKGDMIGSIGMGLTSDPGLFLLTPQAEYVYRPNVYFGPLVQIGFGGGTLFTASGAGRLVLGHHPQLRPSLEGGLGFVAASGLFNSSFGLLLHLGVGFDYMLSPTFGLGTVFRGNFSTVKSFFLSWPILTARVLL